MLYNLSLFALAKFFLFLCNKQTWFLLRLAESDALKKKLKNKKKKARKKLRKTTKAKTSIATNVNKDDGNIDIE